MSDAVTQIPLVDYLVLGDEPHLQVSVCAACGAKFFDRRNACAACSGTEFTSMAIPNDGILRSFTIVAHAAPGVKTPFVAGVIEAGDGTSVRGNIINTEPDPEHVTLGMPVRLATYIVGTDDNGTEAVGFGYEPAPGTSPAEQTNRGQS